MSKVFDIGSIKDPRFLAVFDMIRRTGAASIELRWNGRPEVIPPDEADDYDENDPIPVVWIAVVEYDPAHGGAVKGHECAAGMTPELAVGRLAEQLVDGSVCVHCKRPAGIVTDWERPMPLDKAICWYVYDPERQTFRRSCEGDKKVGRNDPCVCGSGRKFKHCHGKPGGQS